MPRERTSVPTRGPSPEEAALQRQQAAMLASQQAILEQSRREQQILAPYLFGQMGMQPVFGAGGELTGLEQIPGWQDPTQALLEQQQAATEQAQAEQRLLQPFLYQQMGLTPTYGAEGQLTGLVQDPAIAALGQQGREIQQLEQQRTLQALRGELPLEAATQQALEEQETALRQQLQAQFGPGYETATPAQQQLGRWAQTEAGIIEAAQRGQMTLGEQLSLARQQGGAQQQATQQALLQGLTTSPYQQAQAFSQAAQMQAGAQQQQLGALAGLGGRWLPQAAGFAQGVQSAGQAQAPFLTRAQMNLQAQGLTAQLAAAHEKNIYGLVGGVGGAAAGAAAAAFT